MSTHDFDVIVIGAGMAGLCCAGEIVVQGARPLLIAEAKEVGLALKPRMVAGNRGLMQAATVQVGWGGGWWTGLVRRLNAPVKVPLGLNAVGYDLIVRGIGEARDLPQCALSASALRDVLCTIFPMIAGFADELERIFDLGLQIPHTELSAMHDVLLTEWLEDQKADDMVTQMMVVLTSAGFASTGRWTREKASVFGAFAVLRSLFCAEAAFGFVYPDHREGFAIPVAQAIERRGGTVWRGRRASKVLLDNGRVTGVVMEDGTEARAPMVAFACGSDRITSLLDDIPPELDAPLRASASNAHRDFHVFGVLDKPVVPDDRNRWLGVLEAEGTMTQWIAPLHNLVPWSTEPGKQFVMSARAIPESELAEIGTEESIRAGLHDVTESIFPGYKDAMVVEDNYGHKAGHLWFDNLVAGPKLPRTADSVEGLWFVNEASVPTYAIYMEAAASAGIMGARAMRERLAAMRRQ